MTELGQCWACGQKGKRLTQDPLAELDDKIKVCEGCATRREGIRAMYWEDGRNLVLEVPDPDKRDNPAWAGAYVSMGAVPDFSDKFDDL